MEFSDATPPDYAKILRVAGWHVYVERNVSISEHGTRRSLILRATKGECRAKVTADSDQEHAAWPELFQQAQQLDDTLEDS